MSEIEKVLNETLFGSREEQEPKPQMPDRLNDEGIHAASDAYLKAISAGKDAHAAMCSAIYVYLRDVGL